MSRSKSSRSRLHSQIITPGPDLPWELVGPGESHILAELEKLYWIGVEHEVQNIIQTLRLLQRPENSYISVPDEKDDYIYGFDTFIDQVREESREFASRYGKRRRRENADKYAALLAQDQKYEDALKQAFLDIKAERNTMRIRGEVRDEIKNLPKLDGLELRACMLLQAAGFLDIDQVTEYRPTAKARPRIPQLTLSINQHSRSEFHPLHCSACNGIIYDGMFTKLPPTSGPYTICSDCYWAKHYGDSSFIKVHKHSVLHAIDSPTSRRLCHCETVPHANSLGSPRPLFPLYTGDRHITAGKLRCPLLDLPDMVAQAKYRGLLASVGMTPRGSESGSIARVIERVKSIKVGRGEKPSRESRIGIGNLNDMDPLGGPLPEDDIPAFFRRHAEKDLFGDTHMALRVGPLVIENGVENTKSGALITLREPPVFHERFQQKSEQPALVIDGSQERLLWQQPQRPVDKPKRYSAIMKQVVGAPFSGLVDSEQIREQEIIKLVIEASQSAEDPQQEAEPNFHNSRILKQLQDLLGPRVKTYLSSIASQLLSPSTTLTWNPATGNNCHSFCTSLLDPTLFIPLVNGPLPTACHPLYLISFFSPPQPNQPIAPPAPKTKHDVPPGHIEESHINSTFPSDLIDTLTHYSTDWASFPRPLYPHQPLFPWDCTEGYARCPMTCGGCNLSKHVWAFPFDSWSLVSLHLGKEQHLYPFMWEGEYNHVPLRGLIHKHTRDTETDTTTTSIELTPKLRDNHRLEWTQNRLSVLCASWALARGAAGMARSPGFVKSTTWMGHSLDKKKSKNQTNNPLSSLSISRVKEGGIHRAQPNSHYFELGTNAHFFLSAWAGKSAYPQQREYEDLRAARMKTEDVLARSNGRFSSSRVQGPSKKKGSGSTTERSSYAGFEGEDSTRFTGNFQIFYNASYTPGSGAGSGSHGGGNGDGGECVDAQFGSIVGLAGMGHLGVDSGYDPATDPGVNCASGCGSSSVPSGGEGYGGGGGWGDGGGGGYGGGYGGSSGGDGGSSGGGGGGDGGGGGGGGGGDGGG